MAQTRDINLLPYEERAQDRFNDLTRKLSLVSVVFLIICAIFTLVTLVFYTSLAAKRSKLIESVEASSNTINSYKASEELLVVIKNKVSSADKVLSSRTNYPDFFGKFAALTPQGVYLTDFKVNANKVSTNGKARSSADVAGLVASLLSAEGTKLISNVSIGTLSSDEKGTYTFSLSGEVATK